MKKIIKAIAALAVVLSLTGSSNAIKAYAYPYQYDYQCQHYSVRLVVGPVPGTWDHFYYYQDQCIYCGTVFGISKGLPPTQFYEELSGKVSQFGQVDPGKPNSSW